MKNCTVAAEQSGSTKMVKTNSLRQFNYAQILGVPTAAGMKPVIYPIWLHSKCPGGVRGLFSTVVLSADAVIGMTKTRSKKSAKTLSFINTTASKQSLMKKKGD